jgi:hypothetical protein
MAVGAAAVRSLWCCTQEGKNKKKTAFVLLLCFALQQEDFIWVVFSSSSSSCNGNGKWEVERTKKIFVRAFFTASVMEMGSSLLKQEF